MDHPLSKLSPWVAHKRLADTAAWAALDSIFLSDSVIGSGTAAILTDPAEKQHGLNCILQHYGGGSHQFSISDLKAVTVIRIAAESMTGKKHE